MSERRIAIVGPMLRGLCGGVGGLPAVRFEPGEREEALALDISESASEAEVLNALRSASVEKAEAVAVRGLGVFVIDRTPAGMHGRVAGKIAVVTGAAQGFGLEIARDLAAEGARVVLADVNLAGARAAAEGIPGSVAVMMDVTNAESVESAVGEIVRAFGGFDVFVSNAGVLRASSVKTQTERDFDFVTNVNYRGYFLCVKHAAPVLARQRMARPGYTSDIIQINSKSGLAGSNRNGSYAGSKFGGIGLTQSFALELVDDGIKVNAVCPGNFYDGPLWSDPVNGLFVQYLKSGKVPGARTVEDVRRAYESRTPMGRGCEAKDVMRAVYYLIDQQYETGQALPVTGGQAMLH